jgi:hypothetical protein
MSLANPDRTQVTEPLSACVGPYQDCLNGVCAHVTEAVLTPSEPSEAQEPTYTLTGLSGAGVGTLIQALYAYNECVRDRATTNRISELLDLLDKLNSVHDEYECMHYDDGCRCQCSYCN